MVGIRRIAGQKHCLLGSNSTRVVSVDKHDRFDFDSDKEHEVWCFDTRKLEGLYIAAKLLRKLPEQELIEAAEALCAKWKAMSPDFDLAVALGSDFAKVQEVLCRCEYEVD